MALMRSATSRSVCVFMVKGYRAYNRTSWRPPDNTRHHIHAHTMECKDTTDELYVLGFIARRCNQVLLEDMLIYLRDAQDTRRQLQKMHDRYRGTMRE